jgi:predicted dehydrogenase
MRVGAVGCGNIAATYFRNLRMFPAVDLVACCDLDPDAARQLAVQFGLEALPVTQLLQREDIDLILNLTPPAAHAELSLAAIDAGKHVFSEKPLAISLPDAMHIAAAASARGVRVGSAPDTFLGPGTQLPRRLMDEAALGTIVSGTAAFMSHGMEHWHPNPNFFYQPGGGPVLDMGPYYLSALVALLGPIRRVSAHGCRAFRERLVTAAGPMQGRAVTVEALTTVNALLSFREGAEIVLMTSWDVWRHSLPPIEIHGSQASLRLPDPDLFGGVVQIARGREAFVPIDTSYEPFGKANGRDSDMQAADYRGVGLAEMADAIANQRPHRCSSELALHVLAVMVGILDSADSGHSVDISVSCERPASLAPDEARKLC